MKHPLFPILAATILLLAAGPIIAVGETAVNQEHQMVIKLKGDDFELHETDISQLEVGDGETIYTESGKRIDLLRSKDGVEVYIDGELLDMGDHHVMLHDGDHQWIHKDVEVICDDDEGCDQHGWISEDSGWDVVVQNRHKAHGEKVILVKKVVQVEQD